MPASAVKIYTALSLIGAGLGWSMVAHSICENNRSDISFIPVRDIQTSAAVVAVVRADENSKLVTAFLDIVADAGGPHVF